MKTFCIFFLIKNVRNRVSTYLWERDVEGEPAAVSATVQDAEQGALEVGGGFDVTGVEVLEVTMPEAVCVRLA